MYEYLLTDESLEQLFNDTGVFCVVLCVAECCNTAVWLLVNSSACVSWVLLKSLSHFCVWMVHSRNTGPSGFYPLPSTLALPNSVEDGLWDSSYSRLEYKCLVSPHIVLLKSWRIWSKDFAWACYCINACAIRTVFRTVRFLICKSRTNETVFISYFS